MLVTIMRGHSGSGKSTKAIEIKNNSDVETVIVSADNFFIKKGKYKFNHNMLGLAHNECYNRFVKALEQGYNVIAVEKSIGMLDEFKRKSDGQNSEIEIHNCPISEYENGKADLAIALFTVLSYSITEYELSNNIENICKYINPDGYFFFDLPSTVFFSAGRLTNINTNTFRRLVELTSNNENDIYTYREQCSGIFNGQKFSYEDEFKIRYWEISTLEKLLSENGFYDTLKSFPQFSSTGSTYKLYKRQ